MKTQFDNEELEILKAYKNNKLKVSKNYKKELENSVKIARRTIEQNEELYIKISGKDLRNLRIKELELGIPYQNIITALIHKYLENKIEIKL